MQGAGTIGGILRASLNGTQAFYFYDANGTVSDLTDVGGSSLAHYEFDPYGNTIVASGTQAVANPFRFSTKYTDDETGWVYYGYRYYSPWLGRWINRVPQYYRDVDHYKRGTQQLLSTADFYVDFLKYHIEAGQDITDLRIDEVLRFMDQEYYIFEEAMDILPAGEGDDTRRGNPVEKGRKCGELLKDIKRIIRGCLRMDEGDITGLRCAAGPVVKKCTAGASEHIREWKECLEEDPDYRNPWLPGQPPANPEQPPVLRPIQPPERPEQPPVLTPITPPRSQYP